MEAASISEVQAVKQDMMKDPLGDFQDNTLYQCERVAISIGHTKGGRHTLALGFIHEDGKFSTRIPLYVDVASDKISGVKAMNCYSPLAESFVSCLESAFPQLLEEVVEFLEARKANKPVFAGANDRKVTVIRSPGKTEREREKKINARKDEAPVAKKK